MGLLLSSKLGIYGAVILAIVIAFGSLYGAYKLKSWQLEDSRQALAQEQANNAALNATVAQQQANLTAVHHSATIQQGIAQQSAPIHQAIEDSTPETLLNEKQKSIADCIVALFRGLLKGGSCSGKAGSGVLPIPDSSKPNRATDG